MRFLLHPTTQRATSEGVRKGRASRKFKESVPSSSAVETSESCRNPASYVQSWGQQCSPNCGCVVRFETKLDPSTNKFISASYHAKSVVVTPTMCEDSNKGQRLEPVMTFRNNRPMFQPCSCDSLHKLAAQVTEYLPDKDALAFGSSMEFTGVRASPAFRHTVLEKQGLSTLDTHCFDVVEEALTAVIKGFMPKPREQVTPKEIYASAVSAGGPKQRGEQERDDQFRIDMSGFWKPPRAMSALHLMDVTAKYSPFGFPDKDQYHEEEYELEKKEESTKAETSKFSDWVSYVDELYAERLA